MKRRIIIALGYLGFFSLCSVAIFFPESLIAQDSLVNMVPDSVAASTEEKSKFASFLISNFGRYFVSEMAFSAVVMLLSGAVIKWAGSSWLSIWKTLCAIIIAVGLSFAGFALQVGIFAGLTVLTALGIGWRIGMGSNSLFDIINGLSKAAK